MFGFHVNYREPSVTPLPVHLPGCEYVIFQEGNEEVAAATTVSELQRYLCRPEDPVFDQLQYCEYYEQYVVGAGRPRCWTDVVPGKPHFVHPRLKRQLIARINILYPNSGDVFYLKLLLLHSSPWSFEQARTVDGTVYDTYHNAAQALGLLHDDSEGQLCFNEARDARGASPVEISTRDADHGRRRARERDPGQQQRHPDGRLS